MRINYNVSAMLSNNALANNDKRLAQSLQRLSSGLKINHAKDNPAGLAMAKRMNAQISGLELANQNAGDGVSIISTADGALSEVSDMLQRMNELAVKAANGTMVDDDRETIQKEIAQLKQEITRISETTEFNGQLLLNGEFAARGYVTKNNAPQNLDIKVNAYSPEMPVGTFSITELKIIQNANGEYEMDPGSDLTPAFSATAKGEIRDNLLTIKDAGGVELTLQIPERADTYQNLEFEVLGIGTMTLQIGANEGQVLDLDIPAISLQNMGIERIDVSTAEGAGHAIERIDGAIKFLSSVRGRLGAYQNRLESTINSLNITSENMTAAYSRIMDVDMAEEMTQYTTNQVLTQAGTSMLAQANERPSQVLQLLQ